MNAEVRILLVDDHTIFRQALAVLLTSQPGLHLQMHCGCIGEALLLLAAATPDVVLLDADLGAERGIDFLVQARRNGFLGPVLVLTAGVSRDEAEALQSHGLAGILRKDVSIDVLAERLREAVGIKRNAGPGASTSLTEKRSKALTPREAEVLQFVIEGHQNKQIAHELGCSEAAVKGIIQQLFHKTETNTRSQLVRAALERYSGQI